MMTVKRCGLDRRLIWSEEVDVVVIAGAHEGARRNSVPTYLRMPMR